MFMNIIFHTTKERKGKREQKPAKATLPILAV